MATAGIGFRMERQQHVRNRVGVDLGVEVQENSQTILSVAMMTLPTNRAMHETKVSAEVETQGKIMKKPKGQKNKSKDATRRSRKPSKQNERGNLTKRRRRSDTTPAANLILHVVALRKEGEMKKSRRSK